MNPSAAASIPGKWTAIFVWLLCYLLTALLYLPFLSAPYFSDDFLFYFNSPPAHLYQYLWTPGAASHLYRPAEAMILTAIQTRFGFETLPIHLIAIAAHASLCCLVWLAALRLGFSRLSSTIAVTLMFVSQTGAPAMLGNDSMSQAASAARGVLAVFLAACAFLNHLFPAGGGGPGSLARDENRSGTSDFVLFALSALAFFGSLLFKETSLGLIVVIAVFAFLIGYREAGWVAGIKGAIPRLLPHASLTLAYLVLRFSAGRHLSSEGAYRVGVGLNVPRNLGQFVFALLNPIPSIITFVAAEARDIAVLGLIAMAMLLVAGSVLAGLWRQPRPLVALLLLCVASAMVPALLLQHVSELYVYNMAPYAALVCGLALGALWNYRPPAKIAVALCLFLMVAGQLCANREKARFMDSNGQAAKRLVPEIVRYFPRLAYGGEILLTESPIPGPKYSVFLLHGLDVLEFGSERLGPIYRRPDVRVRIVPKAEILSLPPNPNRIVLELQDGDLREVKPAG